MSPKRNMSSANKQVRSMVKLGNLALPSLGLGLVASCFIPRVSHAVQPTSRSAQTPDASHADPAHLDQQEPAPIVTFDVVVTDKSGNPISSLDRKAFTVLDNGKPQSILDFQAFSAGPTPAAPEQAIFVLDAINTSFDDMARVRSQLASFLRGNGGKLPIPTSILLLTQHSNSFSGAASRDGASLARGLEGASPQLRLLREAAGTPGDVERDAISLGDLLALAHREQKVPGRKLVIWLGQGWPYVVGPGLVYSSGQLRANFSAITRLSSALREARIELSSVDPRGSEATNSFENSYYKTAHKGVAHPSDAQLENLGLQVLASQSGGLVLDSSNDLEREFATCLQDATAYDTLSIAAPPTDMHDHYHQLTVKVAPPGKERLAVRTRAGYYSQP